MSTVPLVVSVPIIIFLLIISIFCIFRPLYILQIMVRPIDKMVGSNKTTDILYKTPKDYETSFSGQIVFIKIGGWVGLVIVIASFCMLTN